MATDLDYSVVTMPTKRHRLEPVRTNDLEQEVAAEGPVDYLVDEVVAPATQVGLAGAEKTGKTFVGIDLGMSISTGTKFMNHFATKPRGVLLYCPELNRRTFIRRASAIARSKGFDDLHEVDWLFANFRAPQVTSADDRRQIVKTVREHGIGLVYLDPWNRVSAGVSMNQLGEVGAALNPLSEELAELDCALWITAHTTKSSTPSDGLAAFSGVGLQHWARTAGVLRTVGKMRVDAEGFRVRTLSLTFDGADEGELAYTITRRLRRDGEGPHAPISYSVAVEPAQLGGDDEDHLPPADRRTLAAMTANWMTSAALQAAVVDADPDLPRLKIDTVARAADRLVEAGLAETDGVGRGRERHWRLAVIGGAE